MGLIVLKMNENDRIDEYNLKHSCLTRIGLLNAIVYHIARGCEPHTYCIVQLSLLISILTPHQKVQIEEIPGL